MNKFDRVISTLILLQSKKIVTAAELSERFDVSLRTVYRDIRTLETAGVPIAGEPGVGYSILPGYRLPPVIFDEQEALSMLAVEKFVGTVMDVDTAKSYQSALTKIKAVLRSAEKEAVEALDGSIMLRESNTHPDNRFLQQVFRATAAQRVLNMLYQKQQDQGEWRMVEPIGCYYHFSSWYMIAWCRTRQDYRTFRLTRVKKLISTDEHFDDDHPSLGEYIEAEAELRQTQKVEVLIYKPLLEYIQQEKYNFGLLKEEDQGDWVKMTFLVSSLDIIGRWLMTYTTRVQVLSPESLKVYIRNLIQDLEEHYA